MGNTKRKTKNGNAERIMNPIKLKTKMNKRNKKERKNEYQNV